MLDYLRFAWRFMFGNGWSEFAKNFAILLGIWVAMAAIGLALSGCAPSLAPHGAEVNAVIDTVIDTSIKDIKSGNDRLEKIVTSSSCAIPLGAFGRETDLLKSWGLLAMCPEAMAKMQSLFNGTPAPPLPVSPSRLNLGGSSSAGVTSP